jgi:diacylglycerol kinase (ATP)
VKGSSAFSFVRLAKATSYSMAGLSAAWREEAAFRLEILVAAVLVPLGMWLGTTGVERALLAGSVLAVLVVELINSALESTVDCASPGYSELAKRAKDMGSAAVMAALAATTLIWGSILL